MIAKGHPGQDVPSPPDRGPLPNPDGVGVGGGGECPDRLTVYIRVHDDRIQEASFECEGCEAAVACGAAVTRLARGTHLDDASLIAADTVADAVGSLPAEKRHVAATAAEALANAIMDYVVRSIHDQLGQP